MLRLFREARKRWRTLSEVREEMQALRDENAKLAEAVRKYAEENEACMVLVRALRDVNADLDAKLIKWRELWPDWSRSSRRDSGVICEP
jgi:predicted nuclease with TOPRIM domain